ncbi:MAG: amino acid ABC transporter substrate-binding protein [Tepidanaerobacter acetatoxydans]|uniref:amino acid ABC transporter substrate-binding protein n=1 Tax=Tepidanaerobacter TaxID=499228 RepID=UPI000AB8A7B6|nr:MULTISPECIES: amino acid ABC transporter substrate-binding protein [Tepidanaerobacter]NLU09781.1 amino acid ABC transporter substrate-binding protein [Tepidanaerobacter acetatoxydans]
MRKSLKTAVILMLVLILGMISLVGCSNEAAKQEALEKETAQQEPAAQEDSFEKIKAKGKVVMGLDDTFAPMGFRDENNKIVGFDVDLAQEVFKRNDLELVLQPIDWTMKEAELNAGNIDMIWNAYTITEERKEKVAFTKPYLDNRQVIVTLEGSDVKSKSDLAGKKVAAQTGSSAVDAMNTEPELVKSFDGGEPVLFDTNNEAFMDLEAKRVDAVVADEVLARYYIKQKGADKYTILDEDFGDEEYGIGFRKQDKKLLEMVDKTLDDMRKDGSYDLIYEKWFGK